MKRFQLLALAVLISSLSYCAFDNYKHRAAHRIQKTLQQEINTSIKNRKDIMLAEIGGIAWDYVCFASHEAKGTDVADGIDVARYGLNQKNLSFDNYSIANQYYVDICQDCLYGLVFVSKSQKILTTTSFEKTFSATTSKDTCIKASSAKLLNEGQTPAGLSKLKLTDTQNHITESPDL